MNRLCFAMIALASSLVVSACAATVADVGVGYTFAVERRPPAPLVEVAPPTPGAAYVWVPGYWRWNGYDHSWVRGYWVARPSATVVWLPSGWVHVRGRYRFVPGRWVHRHRVPRVGYIYRAPPVRYGPRYRVVPAPPAYRAAPPPPAYPAYPR